jgi:hemerythrin
MAKMEWQEFYSVNIKSIDDQHKKWLVIINNLDSALTSGESDEILGPILREALDYTDTHFSYEEQLMRDNGYPDYDSHKNIHDTFSEELKSLYNRNRDGESWLAIDTLSTFGSWLIKHILEEDKKYTAFLNEKGIT